MGRNKGSWSRGTTHYNNTLDPDAKTGNDPWKRQRKERINHSPSKINVDVHGILFAVVAVVFVVYPLIQWALGR